MFSLLDMLEKLGLSVARQGQYFKIPEIAWGNTRRTAAGDTIAEAVRKCQEAFGAAPNIIFVNLPTNGVALYQVIVRPQCAHRGIISLGHMHACKLWHAACRHESMHKDLTRGHICSKIRILQSDNAWSLPRHLQSATSSHTAAHINPSPQHGRHQRLIPSISCVLLCACRRSSGQQTASSAFPASALSAIMRVLATPASCVAGCSTQPIWA